VFERGDQAVGARRLHQRRHRLPGLQAAGHRRNQQGARAHARARAGLSRRPDVGKKHHRRRLRPREAPGGGNHARGARSYGIIVPMNVVSLNPGSTPPVPAVNAPVAKLYGHPVIELPHDLYIPPDALEVVLEAFEGPLDLLLFLIRKENLDILDIPMAPLTRQYLEYVEIMRSKNLELAAEYLVMAAMLMEIKSRLLLPRPPSAEATEEDPRAELVRRLLEYEQIKK